MDVTQEIQRARTEATQAKQQGRDPKPAQNRLRELYKITKRSKKPRVRIA